jgi:Pyruvate/2-oxoacid:ferredoxin oxidoreductase delta subunit
VNLLDQRQVGARVVVVGGGDAAIDAARTAVRLSANQVQILYRRSEQEMPASAEEIEAARAEGVELALLTVPVGFDTDADGAVIAARVVECELGEPDASGRRRPVPMPETEAPLSTDHVILALGQRPDAAALAGDLEVGQTKKGYVPAADKSGATADPRVFCAGDLTGEGWTVIAAMAQGKRAAHGIDLLLAGGAEVTPLALHTVDELPEQGRYQPAGVKAATRAVPAERSPGQRSADFEAVSAALTAGQVVGEAERCLSCGQCARCNNCIDNFGCPAIFKKDGKVYIDEVLCVGCGVCAQLCPNDAIEPGRAPTPEKS